MHSCKKPYAPELSESVSSVLVVEGTIAVGANTENRFLLSRLRPLQDTTSNDPETGASISIVSEGGQSWSLAEKGAGTYTAELSLASNSKYKLKIATQNGRQFETAFLEVKSAPPIDSITWSQPDGVEIFVHTHDPANKTRFYRWEFTETWEYHAAFDTNLGFKNGQIYFRDSADLTYACWRSLSSGSIIIGNTNALSEDRVSYQLIQKLPRPDERASFKYSILVRQFGLPEEAYNFWNILRKNTELTGTLFDPQPSQLPGNITCLNDASEKVIGFISAGQVTEKRIYIKNTELLNWPSNSCSEVAMPVAESLSFLSDQPGYGPAYFFDPPDTLAIARKSCLDCRLNGGTTTKPPYWQ